MVVIPSKTIKAFCSYPFQKLKVDSEGYCTFCCHQTRKCLGNLLEQSLYEIWNGDLAKEIRQQTLNGNLHPLCKVDSCPLYWKAKLEASEFIEKPFPQHLEIDLPNTHCNIGGINPTPSTACLMCERARDRFIPQKDKVSEICKRLRPYVPNLLSVHIQGVAEPFWKDKIFEIASTLGIDEYKDQITISTTTNGTLLNETNTQKWLQYPRSTIVFSLDAGSADTYKKIRKVNLYDSVIESIMKLSSQRSDISKQLLIIHNNINMLNVGEVKEMVEVAAKVKANEINFNPTYALQNLVVSQENSHLFFKAQKIIVKTAKDLGVRVSFMRELSLDFLPLVQIKI